MREYWSLIISGIVIVIFVAIAQTMIYLGYRNPYFYLEFGTITGVFFILWTQWFQDFCKRNKIWIYEDEGEKNGY